MKRQSLVRWFLGSAALMAAASLALAQTAVDFPGLKGAGARSGRSGDPSGSYPGQAPLKWFYPAGPGAVTPILIDNTDVSEAYQVVPTTDQRYFENSPYSPNLVGIAAPSPKFLPNKASYDSNKDWVAPPVNGEATFFYTTPIRTQPVVVSSTTYPINYNTRKPSYVYTRCTASAVGTDPTIAAVPANRRYFEWRFKGPSTTARNYAVYANIPVGPTRFGIGQNDIIFPQRYYVFEIFYGNGQRYVDVVDTYAAGGGMVRLGGGGTATNAVFPFDGKNQISVRLYNTIPRDSTGKLTMTGTPSSYAVYGDAIKGQPTVGYYSSSPVAGAMGGNTRRVVAALNQLTTDIGSSATTTTRTRGVVTSYNHDFSNANLFGNIAWQYVPFADRTGEGSRDNESADVTRDADWLLITNTRFQNGDYRVANVTTALASRTRTTYAPILGDGNYDIYAYLPGNSGGKVFGRAVRYEINEGTTQSVVTLDQSRGQGYVKIGSRRFKNVQTGGPAAPLSVSVTNYSTNVADAGRNVYADSILFVGEGNIAVNSTPTLANVRLTLAGGTVGNRSVVVVADESGRLHCLDWTGRADDTTDVYWVYPSKRRAGFLDPNISQGIDGKNNPAPSDETNPTAVMPSGFNQSSALIQRIAGEDYLFIASTNGRVYCLAMNGRGDYDTATRTPGTTRRVWTWPDDFPSVAKPALTGGISGSISYANTAAGPTIFVTSNQGRIYALNAKPTDSASLTGRKTQVRWAFPPEDQPNLPRISMTPTVEFNKLYFGTQQTNEQYARFYAVNIDTGLESWRFPTDSQVGTSASLRTNSWLAGPATATSVMLSGQANTVYAINQNRYLYALNADTGTTLWSTNELGVGSSANLGFTFLDVFDNSGTGTKIKAPVVMVPTDNGRFVGMFARTLDVNRVGGRRAWEFKSSSDRTISSMANAINWMYGADTNGFLYGFSDQSSGFPSDYLNDAPGQEQIVENNPAGDLFRGARVAFVNYDVYQRLRLGQDEAGSGGSPGHPEFKDLIFDSGPNKGQLKPGVALDRNPAAFEWGETVYIFAYDFPFVNERSPRDGVNLTPPPQVNVSLSVEGNTARTLTMESRQFSKPTLAPANTQDPQWQNDGYAVTAYTFQGGGPSALPPGNAILSTSISTSSLGTGALQQISLNEAFTSIAFQVANPLAVSMVPTMVPTYSIGSSLLPNDPENLVNGSPDIGSALKSHLLKSAGFGNHGSAKTASVYVTDRSMMGLIRPDGQGLDNVRVDRAALVWQGQTSTIYKPLDLALYPGFEDLPTSFPNRSLDYPDIRPENLRITKDPNGNAENPVFAASGVTLTAPLVSDGGTLRPMRPGDLPSARVFRPTQFDFEVNVPRYQPANTAQVVGGGFLPASSVLSPNGSFTDSANAGASVNPQGYIGRQYVYVDSSQDGLLNDGGREAFRSFVLSTAVVPDQRLSVSTPTVDPNSNQGILNLGSLAGGFGYMLNPTAYSPWVGEFTGSFQSYAVLNEGNVNLRDVRLAKLIELSGNPSVGSWRFNSAASDGRAWLDGSLDLWSNFDTRFAPSYGPGNTVSNQIVQKPRVGDTVPTTLVVNPSRRENANLGVTPSPLVNGPQSAPKVSVTIPFGFPVGTYSQTMRVIENENSARNDQTWNLFGTSSVESYTDPTFSLIFSVRESRLTNRSTRGTDVQIDNLTPEGSNSQFAYKNAQPSIARTTGGGLVLAWASDRPTDTPASNPTSANANASWRIFFAGLRNQSTFSDTSVSTPGGAGYSSIRDLNFWAPATGQWFRKAPISANGYPAPGTNFSTWFNLKPGEAIEPGTEKFYYPTFAQNGFGSPFNPRVIFPSQSVTWIAFVGEAMKRSGNDLVKVSQVFAAPITVDSDGNVTAIGSPLRVASDLSTQKGKPSIISESAQTATIIFPETGPNGTAILSASLDFNVPGVIGLKAENFGAGFSNLGDITVTGRSRGNQLVYELLFSGQLKGSTTKGLFRGVTTGLGGSLLGQGNTFQPLPYRTNEVLTSVGSGKYIANGVSFNPNQPVLMQISVGGAAPVALARPNTQIVDRETGVISFESILGGRVFIDPFAGSVRFGGSAPARNAQLLLSYQPYFARISETNSGYSSPVLIFDNRKTTDTTYWSGSGTANAQNDRLVVMATRGGGAGLATRPIMKTLRLGVQLPTRILTRDNGAVVALTVTGNTGPYQVDPATGRVYFTVADDGRAVTVTYTGADRGTGASVGTVTVSNSTIDMITESEEALIPIEQAVNEGGLAAIADPFDPNSNDERLRRPAMYWIIWSSTRGGVPDLYIQTIAPRLAPAPLGR